MEDFRFHRLTGHTHHTLQTLLNAAIDAIVAYDDLVATIHADIARRHPGLPLPASAHQAPRGMQVCHAFARLLARVLPLGRAGLLPHDIEWVVLDGRVARSADEVRWVLDRVGANAGHEAAERWLTVVENLANHAGGVRSVLAGVKAVIVQAVDHHTQRTPPPGKFFFPPFAAHAATVHGQRQQR
jgi:hypothetical protein